MRRGSGWLAIGGLFCGAALAQVGPSQPYPIAGAAPKAPTIESQKDRTAVVDVTVGANGRTVATRLVTRSGNGVYDERVRGYWKDQPFVPALDAAGKPRQATVRIRNEYRYRPPDRNARNFVSAERFHGFATIEGRNPAAVAERITRMSCRDFLWEFDFMRGMARKGNLRHEDIFYVAFAMFVSARQINDESRDALILQWDTLADQTVDSCRAQPAGRYWNDAFVHTFESATPVGVLVP